MPQERTHRLEHSVHHWRAPLKVLTLFVQFMADALDVEGTHDVEIDSAVYVEYTDGKGKWDSLRDFANGVDSVPVEKAQSIRFQASRSAPSKLSLTVLVSEWQGLHVVVEGERELLVHGLLDEARRWAEKGRVPAKNPQRRAPNKKDLAVGSIILGLGALFSLGIPLLVTGHLGSLAESVVIGVLGIALTVPLIATEADPLHPDNPRLELTDTGKEPGAGATPPPGLAARFHAWLKRHLVLSFAATFALGVLINKVSDLLPG